MNLQPGDLKVAMPIMLALLAFVLYWFTAQSEQVKAWFYDQFPHDDASARHIFFTKVFGFVSMGLLPLLIACVVFRVGPAAYGLTFIPETTLFTIFGTLFLLVIVIPLAYFNARKPEHQIHYPQIRARIWTRCTMALNVLGWTLYLLGYETLFRGILLFPLASEVGWWPAIAVNIALYSATHIPKGLGETLGAVLLGAVLGVLTLLSGTLWIAFLVHLTLALTNSLSAFKYHPDMHYTGPKE